MKVTPSKTYLVTGAAGFIGARFVQSCHDQGIQTISVDQEDYFKSRPEKQTIDFGTIVDLNHLMPWLQKNSPPIQAIIHLGAITDTRASDLEQLNRLNLNYSQNLWTYASQNQIPFVYASSAATYGAECQECNDDESLIPNLHPLNAYGESKQKFDLWALDQEKRKISCPPTWAGFKFFNVYGYGERHKNFMSSVVLHAFDEIQKTGQSTLFRSHRTGIPDGFQKRDFVFVEDVVKVLHFAVEKPIQRGIYNLGTGQARTFLDLARATFKALHKPENIQFKDTPLVIRDKYQYFTQARMEKLRSQGYKDPFTSLEDGIKSYVDHLLSSPDRS